MDNTRPAKAESESAKAHREKTKRSKADLHAVAAAKKVVEKSALLGLFASALRTVLGKPVLPLSVAGSGVSRRVSRRSRRARKLILVSVEERVPLSRLSAAVHWHHLVDGDHRVADGARLAPFHPLGSGETGRNKEGRPHTSRMHSQQNMWPHIVTIGSAGWSRQMAQLNCGSSAPLLGSPVSLPPPLSFWPFPSLLGCSTFPSLPNV